MQSAATPLYSEVSLNSISTRDNVSRILLAKSLRTYVDNYSRPLPETQLSLVHLLPFILMMKIKMATAM